MVSYLLTFQPVRRLEAYEAFNLVTFYPFSVVQIGTNIFFLNGPFTASFSLFLSFQYAVASKQIFNV